MTNYVELVCYSGSGDNMKKVVLSLVMISVIAGILIVNGPKVEKIVEEEQVEKRSIFISYIELEKYLKGKSEEEGKENITKMIHNIKDLDFNEVIVQVRSFCDAIYPSDIFPWSKVISSEEGVEYPFDVLKYFVLQAHENDVSFVAWINPYRVRTKGDLSDVSKESPAFQYIGTDTLYVGDAGIYFNPAKDEVDELVINGVEEIISNYEVDGILFDDYFYPNDEIDMKDYEKYLENNEYVSKDRYSLDVINEMIRSVFGVCHEYGVRFGVSPDGNMENNYEKVYADVKEWCSSYGYIDFIMPQVYYGFYNETKAFKSVIEEWESIVLDEDIEMYVALAFYKVGEVDKYAKSGMYEWTLYSDIIMREIVMSRNLNKYKGFSLFRYDYLFNEELYNEMTILEIENMKKVLN